jgi:hypothetical protein
MVSFEHRQASVPRKTLVAGHARIRAHRVPRIGVWLH